MLQTVFPLSLFTPCTIVSEQLNYYLEEVQNQRTTLLEKEKPHLSLAFCFSHFVSCLWATQKQVLKASFHLVLLPQSGRNLESFKTNSPCRHALHKFTQFHFKNCSNYWPCVNECHKLIIWYVKSIL